KKVAFIPTPETPTNCTFGGEDWKTLYVTAGKSLYRIRLNAAGFPEHTPPGEKNLRGAIERGLRRLEEGARNYVTHRDCFSCHHQAMAITALSKAKRLGFEIDEELLRDQVNFTLDFFRPKLETIRKGSGVGGANATASYALYTLEAAGHPADETTDALVQFLVRRQRGDGSWPSPSKRPPTEGSPFTNAGLALQVLKTYGKARPDSGQPDDWSEQVARAIGKGREWLLRSEPSDTEDRVFHLRALLAIGADAKLIDAAREELIELQHADGSWSQLPGMEGDAYATGTVLVALRLSGVPADHPAVRKGVSYLLRTQRDDGAWLVETRSRPIQVFFDNGDPGGKSQFISMAATGWGVLALLEVFDREAGR
ncbi:MAG TPA: prenyltransferase/squalene oxidase repeat-containing protein, partial [Gemmataceae bacterium]